MKEKKEKKKLGLNATALDQFGACFTRGPSTVPDCGEFVGFVSIKNRGNYGIYQLL